MKNNYLKGSKIAEFIGEQNTEYENAKKFSLLYAQSIITEYSNYRKYIAQKKSLTEEEIFKGIEYEYAYKYLNQYRGVAKKYFLDIEKLDSALHDIEKDERVFCVLKKSVLGLADSYFNYKIFGDLLSKWEYTKNKVKSNQAFFIFKEAITQSNANNKDPLKRFEYDSSYGMLTKFIDSSIDSWAKELKIEINKNSEQEKLLLILSGNQRKIEKYLFPKLYDHIILRNDLDKENTSKSGISIKRTLLFDLFKVLMPDRNFISPQQFEQRNIGKKIFYDNNYYLYKNVEVESIIGC